MDLISLKKWYAQHKERLLSTYRQFLSIPSISADSAYHPEARRCAEFLVNFLRSSGLKVTLWNTPGLPIVFAEKKGKKEGCPTLLVYHHYDVQPVDPLELWKSPPFEPTEREGAIYARGAQDNKGQCIYSLYAIKAFLETHQDLNFNLKIFIEGEEESGSAGTLAVLPQRKQELKSDYLLVVDSGILEKTTPAISLSARGIVTMEIEVRTADVDMHSGTYGGIAYNPLRAITEMLSTFWDAEGRIAIPDFYDDVKVYSREEQSALDLELDEQRITRDSGLRLTRPDPGFSLGQSVSIRPTIEINGLSGGYTGQGFKTVIPAVAKAKLSSRLVAHQDPQKVTQQIVSFLQSKAPKGAEVKITVDQQAAPFFCKADSPIAKMAAKAYEEVMGKPCQKIMGGGSVPVIAPLVEASEAMALGMGFGLDSDLIHSPNEHFSLDRVEKGFLTMGRILSLLNEEQARG